MHSKTVKKSMKIIILLFIAVFVIGIGVFIFMKNSLSMWTGERQAEDYEKRIEIWNTAAGNSADLKTDHMNIPSRIWICKGRSDICVTIANNITLTRKKSV